MGALVLLPPLPPEPAVVRRAGQQCFGFIEITFVVRAVRARASRRVAGMGPAGDAHQLRIDEWKTSEPTHGPQRRKRTSTKLRLWEREQMHEDIRELTAAGVYETRPIRGNGIGGELVDQESVPGV